MCGFLHVCFLTNELSDRRTDVSKPETPRPNPTAQPGSLQRLVRQSNVHELKNLRPNSTQSQRRPALPLRQKCNRATHEYKSAPSCGTSPTVHRRKRRKQRGKLSLRSLRLLLVAPALAGGSDRLRSIDDENCPFNI